MSLVLVSCAPSNGRTTGGGFGDADARKGNLTTDFSLQNLRELAAESDNSDIAPVEVSAIKTMNKGFKNVNTKMMLFDQPVGSEEARFERLEGAVQGIHDDLSELKPGIKRLIAIEQDIKDLHSKLSQMVENDTLPDAANISSNRPEPRRLSLNQSGGATQAPAPDVVREEKAEDFLPSKNLEPQVEAEEIIHETKSLQDNIARNGGVAVTVRAWESADKTRIVFETPRKEDYALTYDKDTQSVILDTDLIFAQDQLNMVKQTSNQVVDTQASRNASRDITRLIIKVQNVSGISDGYYLPPERADQDHRYYFDIFK